MLSFGLALGISFKSQEKQVLGHPVLQASGHSG